MACVEKITVTGVGETRRDRWSTESGGRRSSCAEVNFFTKSNQSTVHIKVVMTEPRKLANQQCIGDGEMRERRVI